MAEDAGTPNSRKGRNIIQATYETIVENGLCDITTKMISQRAEASKGLIHYYFENKEMLIVEVIRTVLEGLLAIVAGVIVDHPSNEERIDKGLSSFWEGFKADPGIMIAIYEATINGRRNPEILKNMTEFYRRVAEQLEDAVLASDDLPAGVSEKDVQAVVSIILWVIEGMTLHYILDPETTDFDYSLEMFKKAARTMLYRPETLESQPGEPA
ncbi:MAG: TetR/AcrR family transcriptional regulator [Actinobacteria bacterium]|nr:TetR/AcrR family transcriptional regulator [Actinomycetota bacterium]